MLMKLLNQLKNSAHPLNNKEINISVVYLIWVPYGVELLNRFLQSYQQFPAGAAHQLVFLINGVNEENDATPFIEEINQWNIPYEVFFKKKGQDLEAYAWIAPQLISDYIMFLNSSSQIKATAWLEKMTRHLNHTTPALIAPTASNMSYYDAVFENHSWKWNAGLNVAQNIATYKLLLKALFYWRWLFPRFPNPHIRTSAFLIERQLLLKLNIGKVSKKIEAYRLENGYHSITRRLQKMGHPILIVDNAGKAYPINQWKNAGVFWTGNQENLLISDKQTEMYEGADEATKIRLNQQAWGKS